MGDQDTQAFLASKKEEEEVNPEEEVKGNWAPLVDLEKVDVVTGEESMDLVFKARARVYRWREEQWKERGTGDCKMLHAKDKQRVIFILRQDSTRKVVVNFIIEDDPLCVLAPHAGSDRAFLWMATDHSEEEEGPKQERFAIRFNTVEEANKFKDTFNASKAYNNSARAGTPTDPPATVEDIDTTPPPKKPAGTGETTEEEKSS